MCLSSCIFCKVITIHSSNDSLMEHLKPLHSSPYMPFLFLLPSSSFQWILKWTDFSDRKKYIIFFSWLSFSWPLPEMVRHFRTSWVFLNQNFHLGQQKPQAEWSSSWPASESQELPHYTHLPVVRRNIQDMSGWAYSKQEVLRCQQTKLYRKQIWKY